MKNSQGKDEVVAVGTDGTLYTLELSDESKQEDYSEWLRRRGNRTRRAELVTYERMGTPNPPISTKLTVPTNERWEIRNPSGELAKNRCRRDLFLRFFGGGRN